MVILIFLLLFVVVIFAVQNSHLVEISFLSWSFSTVQALVILASMFIGLLIGWTWSWWRGGKTRGQVRRLSRELDEAQRKLKELEALEAGLQMDLPANLAVESDANAKDDGHVSGHSRFM